MKSLDKILAALGYGAGRLNLESVPDGYEGVLATRLALKTSQGVIFVARNDAHMAAIQRLAVFLAPNMPVWNLPSWDCLPYDRVSPNAAIVAQRIDALTQFLHSAQLPFLTLTTVDALLQKLPPREHLLKASLKIKQNGRINLEKLTSFLESNGYSRASTVMEPGEYALRGGIIDFFPPGLDEPVRIDLFGDDIEKIRCFDPFTQRSKDELEELTLVPVSEYALNEDSINRFRRGYRELFGIPKSDDPIYSAVSEGRKQIGIEHWMPLFHDRMETLFDYLPDSLFIVDHLTDSSCDERLAAIDDYYQARLGAMKISGEDAGYKPIPPGRLYLTRKEWDESFARRQVLALTPFSGAESGNAIFMDGRVGRDFAAERAQGQNVYEAFRDHLDALKSIKSPPVILSSFSRGSAERLALLLKDHGIDRLEMVDSWADVTSMPKASLAVAVLGVERGFTYEDFILLSEQDLLGDRLIRPRRQRRADNFLSEVGQINPGDYVVHLDHGVGRYIGLQAIEIDGAPHDCLQLEYADEAKLYLPVENIEMLSRYGSEGTEASLDKLGGVAWQNRKARLKKRLKDMAADLIRLAAERSLARIQPTDPPEGLYQEFAARFPYEETDDQSRAIEDVLNDLASNKPMDRLVCGDVGFGKTEVALRAAYSVAITGRQVALICPTTLLARQHFKTFQDRFAGLPIRIEQLSRFVAAKKAEEIRTQLKEGQVDIIIGTHALLSSGIGFRDLALLIVDEEQHFGVKHKERLKSLKEGVHVLTLSATPIPRTLQLALSGVRELSLIATPPVDRLAVRTFITPFDPVVLREALLREHYRGGQSFVVCPRLLDLPDIEKFLRQFVPEVKVGIAHGQMAASALEDVMAAFYDRKYDVLLSTNIVESGLDIPSANTLIIHRSDMFGLAQLYQLRGRVGRSKLRGYAYMTYPASKSLSEGAEKRLKILSTLDNLGAGFQLASHDLDIRGAGNLLGEEQSGHIREVGFELYQQMLEDAILEAKEKGVEAGEGEDRWSPQIALGASVLIPESYVSDLSLRMQLYRRLGDLVNREDLESFAVEMIDRFGPMPDEFRHLLDVVSLKALCRRAGIEKLEAGPKGMTMAFRNNIFANPAGLVNFIAKEGAQAKLRPDHKLVLKRDWPDAAQRLKGASYVMEKLAALASENQGGEI